MVRILKKDVRYNGGKLPPLTLRECVYDLRGTKSVLLLCFRNTEWVFWNKKRDT
jgi:hypothetical protein